MNYLKNQYNIAQFKSVIVTLRAIDICACKFQAITFRIRKKQKAKIAISENHLKNFCTFKPPFSSQRMLCHLCFWLLNHSQATEGKIFRLLRLFTSKTFLLFDASAIIN